ncbi:hypothetical protein HG536_0G02140 [Torulaspora globosa]|uniref:Micro-fibrillar-associated protein 1 C-terminal domain-containing protein n=1 Tax=Torulaspora globosa TaxID=48254 RepID=A0A7G3ZLG9_9SACH|nr:uncharacterized protein HG536_0G02140 [Torulaspora globosa]QLL34355.1 hypothetical protein HG536_0G02140 [Torulaspora globosa]
MSMSVRHFRGKSSRVDDSLESVVEDTTQPVISRQDEISDSESSDDEPEETSSSEEDEKVVAIQRPQFLNKVKRQQTDAAAEDREAKRRDTLNERIRQENLASEAREKLESQLSTAFGTNDDLLRRILALDDNDAVDPEHERQEWLIRCAIRKKLRRDALLAKQLEMEQYEANKLNIGQPADPVNKCETALLKPELESTGNARFKKPSQQWKPSKALNPRFSSSTGMPEQKEETEYSYI